MNVFERWKFGNFLKSVNISKIDTLSGLEFEEFIANFFAYLNYECKLTSHSGDNGIDILVKSRQYSIGIQTKLYYNHNVNNKAIQEVFSGKNYYGLDYSIVVTNWKFSTPATELARKLGVALIDRSILYKMLRSNRKTNKLLIKKLINGDIL